MRPRVLLLSMLAACASAGTIQGVALEHASGRPMARTVIQLQPVPQSGAQAQALTVRAGRSGQFEFPPVAPGIYLLTATRPGYFPAGFGQRLPAGRGTPIEVTADSKLFAELRLRRKGSLTGRALDENGIGTAGVPVVAYPARLPLRTAGSATSDDRGVFRIYGLDPGRYWIRSAAHKLDDGSGWLPTFGPAALETREARVHQVTLDSDAIDCDVSPEPGALFSLGGKITCDIKGPVRVTLSSETGRRRAQSSCPGEYRFDGLAPAAYEVFATLEDDSAAGFTELFVGQDQRAANVHLMELPEVKFEVRRPGGSTPVAIPVSISGRRQDLSETEPPHLIEGPSASLAPGYWEFRARAPSGYYVESISEPYRRSGRSRKAERSADWYEVFIEPRPAPWIWITVSDRAGEIAGLVKAEGSPVPGAPVFLWPVAAAARRSLGGPMQALSDAAGRFRFDSLPPGDYRAVASFDIHEVDEELIELSRAPVIAVEASRTTAIDLSLWIAPY
ncbi:MAG: hypothetical protein KIT09_12505 [Bryobacteraceae bacterium]|nr:hypothetical protein [Bryobacteraceae bacterium]